jgi:hypothetical protein
VSIPDVPLTKPYAILLMSLSLAGRSSAADSTFQKTVEPFLAKNCTLCHNAKIKTAEVNLDYHDAGAVLKDRDIWENVLAKLRSGQMPPKGAQQPRPEEV